MGFLEIAKNRYTTKKYNGSKKIDEQLIFQLKEILMLSPSSINSQPWKFIFVSDEKLKTELAEISYFNAPKIKDASHLVVFTVINDIAKFEKQIHENLPEGSVNYFNQFLKPQSDFEIKAWLKNQVYLSLGFFLSACASMSIDSTPMEGVMNERYNTILGLEEYSTLFAVAIGYRDEADQNQPNIKPKARLPLEKVVISK